MQDYNAAERKDPVVRVGLIGYGFAGKVFHAPVIEAVPGMELAAIVTSKPDEARKDYPGARICASVEELLADERIDLVVVATPNTTHFPFAEQALRAGKHVVVEKPFVNHNSEGEALIHLAQASGRVLSVYHNRRWDNDFLTIRRLVEDGRLGDVYVYKAHFDRFRPVPHNRWREQELPGSGTLFDLGSHLIDQALQLFGRPDTIAADVLRQRPGSQATDYWQVTLGYGVRRVILQSASYVREPGPRYEVHGSRASFIKYGIDPQEAALIRGERPGTPDWGMDTPEQYGTLVEDDGSGERQVMRVPTLPGAYTAYYQGIYEAIVHGQRPPVTAEEALDVIRVIELAYASAAEGLVIRPHWPG